MSQGEEIFRAPKARKLDSSNTRRIKSRGVGIVAAAADSGIGSDGRSHYCQGRNHCSHENCISKCNASMARSGHGQDLSESGRIEVSYNNNGNTVTTTPTTATYPIDLGKQEKNWDIPKTWNPVGYTFAPETPPVEGNPPCVFS